MKIKRFKANNIAIENANKHNALSEITRQQFSQVAGQMHGVSQNFKQMHDRVGALERDVKLLSFYLARSREENLALRTLLTNNFGMDKFSEVFDGLLRRDFLVDSNNNPVGSLQVTEYN